MYSCYPEIFFELLQEDGSCDANSIPCKLRPQSIVDMDSPLHETGGSKTGSAQFRSVTTIQLHLGWNTTTVTDRKEYQNTMTAPNVTEYIDGCCSGLTMDLLIELMKDLNFEVELYEVADGLWGAWTVSLKRDSLVCNQFIVKIYAIFSYWHCGTVC
ncbi:hypothetical protein AHF37_12678 [Paragonimus kellicotti]|nr:hypothetical protein AHF37_12678 [Paragonimus kellicotti]